jgi:hypothetical protein
MKAAAFEVHEALDQQEERFAQREPALRAFLTEKDRFARLHREAEEAFAAALCDEADRPDGQAPPRPLALAGGTGDPVMNLPWTHAGLPTLATPAGRNAGGLPMGLQLTGRWQGDEDLLRFGQEIARVAEGERRG